MPYSDLISSLPEVEVFDWSNCAHEHVQKNGTDRNGRVRFRCRVCGRTFLGPGQNKWDIKRERIARAWMNPGATIRSVAKETGCGTATARKVRKIIGAKRLGKCVCGQPMGHRGWCRFRFSNSPARQSFMKEKWGQRQK